MRKLLLPAVIAAALFITTEPSEAKAQQIRIQIGSPSYGYSPYYGGHHHYYGDSPYYGGYGNSGFSLSIGSYPSYGYSREYVPSYGYGYGSYNRSYYGNGGYYGGGRNNEGHHHHDR